MRTAPRLFVPTRSVPAASLQEPAGKSVFASTDRIRRRCCGVAPEVQKGSEAVLAACVGPLGLDPVISIAAATAGNVAGGMTCYWMGHLGNMEWIEKYFHVKKEKMDRAERFVHGRGAWMAFFAFIPILGSAISIVLGMMRANIWIVILAMTIGKILRYALLVWGVLEASALMH